MTEEIIQTSVENGVGYLTFNRPRALNAFNNLMMHESMAAMDRFAADDDVKTVIVQGKGRAFSAGFDFIVKFWDCPKPTIAVAHGYCLAGAFELALACDITVAAEGTMFGEPEVRFGTGIVAMLLPWVTGPKQAKELLLTGDDRVSAEDALRMGIVNCVVPAGEALPKAKSMARKMVQSAAVSVQLTKQAINRSYEIMGLRQALLTSLDIDVEINATPSWEKREFARIRKEQGVKAAITWRDARFAEDT